MAVYYEGLGYMSGMKVWSELLSQSERTEILKTFWESLPKSEQCEIDRLADKMGKARIRNFGRMSALEFVFCYVMKEELEKIARKILDQRADRRKLVCRTN